MTTGRINQVTIVRRGWPTGAEISAGESSKLLVGAHRSDWARLPASAAGPCRAALLRAICFPPPRSPGHPSTRTDPAPIGG